MALVWDFLSYWLVFLLIILAQTLLSQLVVAYYKQVKRREDLKNPDHLPINTGQWVREALAARGLSKRLRVVATEGKQLSDCFWPSARFIHLAQATYFKKDPIYWAVGAHELGHALYWGKNLLLRGLFGLARMSSLLTTGATTLLMVNILYVDPALTELAWWILIVGLGGSVVVLVDEFLASHKAMAMLREDGRLSEAELRSSRKHLIAAWMTYFGSFVGSLLLVALWQTVTDILEGAQRALDPEPLGGFWSVCVWILGGVMLLRAAWIVYRFFVPAKPLTRADRPSDQSVEEWDKVIKTQRTSASCLRFFFDAFWQLATLGFLLLVWDQASGLSYEIAVAMAVFSVWSMLALVMVVALVPVFFILYFVKDALVSEKPKEEDPEAAALEVEISKGKAEIERWESEVAKEMDKAFFKPSVWMRLVRLREAAFVPLLVMYWTQT